MIAEIDWSGSVPNCGMPWSAELDNFLGDFGGYHPYFAVIGQCNVLYYTNWIVSGALNAVPEAVESFNSLWVMNPIAPVSLSYNESTTIDLSNVFLHPEGAPITVTVGAVSDPEIVSATINGNTLTLEAYENAGITTVTLHAAGGDLTIDYDITVAVLGANISEIAYTAPDSPAQQLYPNNTNPYENSYDDLGWTDIIVEEEGTVISLDIACTWNSVDYASEGSFHLITPSGQTFELFSPTSTGATPLNITIDNLMGESLAGTWIFYMEDAYSDGGHMISDFQVTFTYAGVENPPILNPPIDLTATIDNENITLNWISPFIPRDERELLSFNIWRNEDNIGNVPANVTTYLDENLPTSTYTYYVTAVYSDGESEPSNTVEVEITGANDNTVKITSLNGNYPNPFNPVTFINFSLTTAEKVKIDIYNLRGQKVRTLVNDIYEQGNHSIEWNGQDDNSTDVSSGVYFCKMTTDRYTSTKKMLLLK